MSGAFGIALVSSPGCVINAISCSTALTTRRSALAGNVGLGVSVSISYPPVKGANTNENLCAAANKASIAKSGRGPVHVDMCATALNTLRLRVPSVGASRGTSDAGPRVIGTSPVTGSDSPAPIKAYCIVDTAANGPFIYACSLCGLGGGRRGA